MDEKELVKLYMQLTESPESAARNVFMYVCPLSEKQDLVVENNSNAPPNGEAKPSATRQSNPLRATLLVLFLVSHSVLPAKAGKEIGRASPPHQLSVHAGSSVPPPFATPLSLADVLNLALRQNPSLVRAQKDLEATNGIVIQTRAIALPTFGVTGNYGAVQQTDIDIFNLPEFTFGTPQNWSAQVKLVQSFYQGGRILSALRAARLTKEQSLLNYQTALADTVLTVQLAYYDVLLAAQQITVQEASVELLTTELTDTTRRFDAGTVPRFNVLRAEVELANARPKLINARNSFRIAKNNLANLLGLNVPKGTFEDIPLFLSGKLDAEPYDVELPQAIATALEKRSELGSLRKTEALRQEDIINAKAGYKPVLQGYVGYDYHNSMLSSDLFRTDHGWIAGAQLSWNLFDGLRTQGKVKEATANHERAEVDLDDRTRSVELEVRTAYSNFIEAREVLESQKKVMEEAEEAVRLARARSEAGTGTQLDVLSAQTALTDSRTTQVQALHDYEAARARLQRAIGLNVPQSEGQ
jgi:outer membrane protein TolC